QPIPAQASRLDRPLDATDPEPPAAPAVTLAAAVAGARASQVDVQLAAARTREAVQRVTQARSVLLPSFGGSAAWLDRTFNSRTFGLPFPGPALVGPVRTIDARVRATQSLFDAASWVRIGGARQAVNASRAEQAEASETAAQ